MDVANNVASPLQVAGNISASTNLDSSGSWLAIAG